MAVTALNATPENTRLRSLVGAPGFLLWLLPLFAALVLAGAVMQPYVSLHELLRDPLATAELSQDCCHVHYGLISNLGAIMWFSAGAICLFAGWTLWAANLAEPNAVRFLLAAGLFTGWLGADDLFLIHDLVLPSLGVPELATYSIYGLLGLGYLAIALPFIRAVSLVYFGVAGALLATSVLVDVATHDPAPWRILLEDGAKFLGIACWGAFHITAATTLVRQARSP